MSERFPDEILQVAYMTARNIHIVTHDESDPLSPDAVAAMRTIIEGQLQFLDRVRCRTTPTEDRTAP